jgi:REP element-mobilizing transposase RayT
MPSHIHLILVLEECQLRLSEIVRRLKAVTTKQVRFKLWQPNYYEHVIRDDKALAKVREYIQNNPLMERLKL